MEKKREVVPELTLQEQSGKNGLTPKQLYCLGWHFREMFEACKDEKVADFGKICATCKFCNTCDFDWFSMCQQLQEETGIVVSPLINRRNLKTNKVENSYTSEEIEHLRRIAENQVGIYFNSLGTAPPIREI